MDTLLEEKKCDCTSISALIAPAIFEVKKKSLGFQMRQVDGKHKHKKKKFTPTFPAQKVSPGFQMRYIDGKHKYKNKYS